MDRKQLIEQLRQYKGYDSKEENMRIRMLAFMGTYENCFERALLIGHMTASCWVVNKKRDKVLLIDHVKLEKWLQPGGHCDGDENAFNVALKELEEETGVIPQFSNPDIFDVDIHTIPERKGIPEHEHFDLRYLFIANDEHEVVQNHETNAIMWVELESLEKVTEEGSILRMKSKTMTIQ